MYNSENNNDRSRYEYHYTYRPGGEPVPTLEPAAPQKPKTGMGKRIVAGVLCGALLLGSSFGVGWLGTTLTAAAKPSSISATASFPRWKRSASPARTA